MDPYWTTKQSAVVAAYVLGAIAPVALVLFIIGQLTP